MLVRPGVCVLWVVPAKFASDPYVWRLVCRGALAGAQRPAAPRGPGRGDRGRRRPPGPRGGPARRPERPRILGASVR
eukprot:11172742-Lingulodinium_polyedra.AAC.1